MKVASLMLCFNGKDLDTVIFFCLHHPLKPSQHHGFATADDATERNQTAFEDRALMSLISC